MPGSFGWDYPPGVTGNEPQITGIWPTETIVDDCISDIKKATDIVEEMANGLDDQGCLTKAIDDNIMAVEKALDNLQGSIEGLIPDEPDYEPEYGD